MATLSFSFETGSIPISRIINGLAFQFGYNDTIPNPDYGVVEGAPTTLPNPQTKAQFVKQKIKRFIVDGVHAAEKTLAERAIRDSIPPVNPITLDD